MKTAMAFLTQDPAAQPPVTPAAPVLGPREAPTAAQMLEAARAQRTELRNQLERAEDRREELQSELTSGIREGTPVDRAGLEARLKETDARISALDQEIAAADQRVASAAAVPGATIEPPRVQVVRNGPPEEVFFLGGMFIVFVMLPISIAYARRLWKRGAIATSPDMPAELTDRLNRLEQAVDAVAVELERVGEGQRYVTRVFTESQGLRALGGGAAEPIEVRQRDAVHQVRP